MTKSDPPPKKKSSVVADGTSSPTEEGKNHGPAGELGLGKLIAGRVTAGPEWTIVG